jgi:hypothetical protein
LFGEVLLLEQPGGAPRRARRLELGETGGRNEAWLRDTLFAHSEILPLGDIEPSFGPLIPLCTELRTEAGPIDIAYINPQGRLTLVECKLWRNHEARRKVVAQTLDYARAISKWSYADLQRQVSAATGRKGNLPFELARAVEPEITEHRFADAVTRALRDGRFLLLIAGDGIREDVGGMAELVNRNAASAFSMGLVEVALYDLGDGGLAIQPRVIAQTKLIERTVVIVKTSDASGAEATTVLEEEPDTANDPSAPGGDTPKQAAYRAWWGPVIATAFDDPEQSPPVLRWPNYVRMPLPNPDLWVTAYRAEGDRTLGLFLGGKAAALNSLREQIREDREALADELPDGAEIEVDGSKLEVKTVRAAADFPDDGSRQAWLSDALNRYANAFRSRLGR